MILSPNPRQQAAGHAVLADIIRDNGGKYKDAFDTSNLILSNAGKPTLSVGEYESMLLEAEA